MSRIIRQENTQTNPINVMDFGAVGDGVHDDTKSIQRAIDTATTFGSLDVLVSGESTESSQGRLVEFPPGVYKITDEVDLSGKSNITYNSNFITIKQSHPSCI